MTTDRDEILELLAEIAWILDHRQWDRLGEVLTPDATAYGRRGLAAVTATMQRYLDGCAATQHLTGNHRVRVDGDRATVTSYVRAFHLAAGGGPADGVVVRARPDQYWDFLGEYHDTLVRTEAGWRISERLCLPLASVGEFDPAAR